MVREGKVTQEQKDCNDGSDEAADIGVEQHGNKLLELSMYFAAKQNEYGGFIDKMHKLVLAIMGETDRIRNPHPKGKNHVPYNNICKGLSNETYHPS